MEKGSSNIQRRTTSAYWETIMQETIHKGDRRRPFASKAGYCPTANWYMGNTSGDFVVGASMKLYQGIGNGVEEELVRGAERAGILLGTQVKLPTPHGVDLGGFIDMIALGADGSPTLFEIKTCTNLPNKIKPEHAAQAATYWLFSGMQNVELIYVSRKVQNFPDPTPLIRTFKFDPTEYEFELLNVMRTLETFNLDKPPQRPATYSKTRECVFCDFNIRCWASDVSDFLDNRQMSSVEAKASSELERMKSMRNGFIQKTLMNCRTSVPPANKQLLEDYIKKASKK